MVIGLSGQKLVLRTRANIIMMRSIIATKIGVEGFLSFFITNPTDLFLFFSFLLASVLAYFLLGFIFACGISNSVYDFPISTVLNQDPTICV